MIGRIKVFLTLLLVLQNIQAQELDALHSFIEQEISER